MVDKPRQVRQSDLDRIGDRIGGALIRTRRAIAAGDTPRALEAIADAERYLWELRESGLIDDEVAGLADQTRAGGAHMTQQVTAQLADMCDGCVHMPHLDRCRGYRQPLCGADNSVCGCTHVTPLVGECGDDPREWLINGVNHGWQLAHRQSCALYGTMTRFGPHPASVTSAPLDVSAFAHQEGARA